MSDTHWTDTSRKETDIKLNSTAHTALRTTFKAPNFAVKAPGTTFKVPSTAFVVYQEARSYGCYGLVWLWANTTRV